MDDDSEESTEQDDTTEGDRVTGTRLTQKQGIDYRDYEGNDHCYLRQGWCELNLTHGTNKKDARRPNGDEDIQMRRLGGELYMTGVCNAKIRYTLLWCIYMRSKADGDSELNLAYGTKNEK